MNIYNLRKFKIQVNNEMYNSIENHKNDYYHKLKMYNEKFGIKENHIKGNDDMENEDIYHLEDSNIVMYTKIENKTIKNQEYSKDEYKILLNRKIEYTTFENCKLKNIVFKNCSFTGSSFYKCTFENVVFEDCSFYYEKSITVFGQDCVFIQSSFKKCNIKKNIFKDITLENIKYIKCNMKDSIFSKANMYNIKIIDCDCRGFKVVDSKIENFEIEDECITKFDEYTFIDKIVVDNKNLKSYENASKLYRTISTKFENNNLLNYAGEYYYLHRIAERKVLIGKDKINSYMFWMVCGYGERPTYALITSIELVLIFAILYMFTGLNINEFTINYSQYSIHNLIYMPNLYRDFFKSLYFSITTFTTVGYGDITPVGWSVFLSGIEMLLGVTMVGVWTATLARKITR